MFKNVYKNKKVLITGNTGFKGSWLSIYLSELGAELYGYSLEPPTTPNLFEPANIFKLFKKHIYADVRDPHTLKKYILDISPDFVFHLAAQPVVKYSYTEPAITYETNVMGTVNLLEAVRHCQSVKVCQVITTDKC